jgi:hypothetical protein
MNLRLLLPSVIVIAMSISLTSCGGTKVTSTNERSVGQQLTDLEQARQQGIITDREYARLKRAIINKND